MLWYEIESWRQITYGGIEGVKAANHYVFKFNTIACKISGYHRAGSYHLQFKYAKIVLKSPTSEALGTEEKKKKCNPGIWPLSSLLLCDIIWYTGELENHQEQLLGGFGGLNLAC